MSNKQIKLIAEGLVPVVGTPLLNDIAKHLSRNDCDWQVEAAFRAAAACLEQFRNLVGDELDLPDQLAKTVSQQQAIGKKRFVIALDDSPGLQGDAHVDQIFNRSTCDNTDSEDLPASVSKEAITQAYVKLSLEVSSFKMWIGIYSFQEASSADTGPGKIWHDKCCDIIQSSTSTWRAMLLALRFVHRYHVGRVVSFLCCIHPVAAATHCGCVYGTLVCSIAQRIESFDSFLGLLQAPLQHRLDCVFENHPKAAQYGIYVRPWIALVNRLFAHRGARNNISKWLFEAYASMKRCLPADEQITSRMPDVTFHAESLLKHCLEVETCPQFREVEDVTVLFNLRFSVPRSGSEAGATLRQAARILPLDRLASLLSSVTWLGHCSTIGPGTIAMCSVAAEMAHERACFEQFEYDCDGSPDDLQDSDGNIEPILKDSVLKLVQFITADFPDSSTYKARSVVLTLAEAVSSWFQCNLDAALDDQMIEAHLTEWRDIEVEAELLQRLYKLVPPTRGETYRSASRTTGSTWSSTSCTPRTSYCDAYNPGAWRQVQVVSENTAQTHWSCLYNNLFSRDEDCHFACQG